MSLVTLWAVFCVANAQSQIVEDTNITLREDNGQFEYVLDVYQSPVPPPNGNPTCILFDIDATGGQTATLTFQAICLDEGSD